MGLNSGLEEIWRMQVSQGQSPVQHSAAVGGFYGANLAGITLLRHSDSHGIHRIDGNCSCKFERLAVSKKCRLRQFYTQKYM